MSGHNELLPNNAPITTTMVRVNGVNRWTFQQPFNIYRALHKYQPNRAGRINHFPVTFVRSSRGGY